jgi:creatinine amidohydrolase
MVVRTGLDSDVSFAAKSAGEIDAVGSANGSVLILPVGSVEQHGEHLPVATDTLLASAMATAGAERVARNVPILVAPPVWAGHSPHHLTFAGAMTGEFETLLKHLEEIADSALNNGFDALLLLNGHGGNSALIDGAVSRIGQTHPDREVLGLTYFDLATEFIDDIRDSENGGMAHGGEFETSLMAFLHPELVGDEMPATYWDEHYELGSQDLLDGGSLSVYRTFDEYSESGAIGDPSVATADKGERLFERLLDRLTDVLVDIHEKNRESTD